MWEHQPLIVRRASPGWPLACPCSSEPLLPDPQSSDVPLGRGAHVQRTCTLCGIHTNGEEGLTHICVIRDASNLLSLILLDEDVISFFMAWCDTCTLQKYTHQNLYWNTISVIIHVSMGTDRLLDIRTTILSYIISWSYTILPHSTIVTIGVENVS